MALNISSLPGVEQLSSLFAGLMKNPLVVSALISSAVITFLVPVVGLFFYLTRYLIQCLFSIIIPGGGRIFAMIYDCLTMPGVLLHELSHALFAFLTGAEVREVEVGGFYNGALGRTTLAFRGPALLRAFQQSFSACGPVIMCPMTAAMFYVFFLPMCMTKIQRAATIYLIVCFLLHSVMSLADVRVWAKGFVSCYIVTFAVNLLIMSVARAIF